MSQFQTACIIADCLALQNLSVTRRDKADELANYAHLSEGLAPLILLASNRKLHHDFDLVRWVSLTTSNGWTAKGSRSPSATPSR